MEILTHEAWEARGKSLFGADYWSWRFVCPSCGYIASVRDWKEAGAPEGAVAFSCIGRYRPKTQEAFTGEPGPCNYTNGGLIVLGPLSVEGRPTFDFAPGESHEQSNS
jgi:hypothetical protein